MRYELYLIFTSYLTVDQVDFGQIQSIVPRESAFWIKMDACPLSEVEIKCP